MKKILYAGFVLLMGFSYAQKTKTTSVKDYVNPVKLTKEERNRPYMSEVLKSHDEMTPEEAERRRKNIEAGNPFKKYGYYPKVATLSRGKYLEFHDRDSIISIGSIKYNVKTKDIVELKEIDLSNPDAQPYLDTAGRWFSPDPLSEEFSDWSPYNFVFNNPLRFVDPDGMAPTDDYKLLSNGQIELIKKTQDNSDTIYSTNEQGKVTSNSNSITIAKNSSSDVSIIGELSQTNDFAFKDSWGKATTPFFSEGFTKNLDTAFELYNFLDNNTAPGIEFSLGNYNVNGQNNYQIASMHDVNSSEIKSNRFSNDNLAWSVHNHDGEVGLNYMNIRNQFDADYSTAKSMMWNNYKKNLGYPSFYIVNDNKKLIEINRNGVNTSKTYPFTTQFLKNIKRK